MDETNNEMDIDTNNKIDDDIDIIDAHEIFDMIRGINDPEHPLTLEQLNVVTVENITVNNEKNRIFILFTPTIPHCSMATLIGLSIRVKLLRSLPQRFKVSVTITPGTHASELAINKQLNDKEYVLIMCHIGHFNMMILLSEELQLLWRSHN